MSDDDAWRVALGIGALATVAGPIAWVISQQAKGRDRGLVAGFVARLLATPILVLLPLFAYAMSMGLEPAWPGALRVGWASCLSATSYVWLPVVLWASAAMYAAAVLDLRTHAWIRSGLLAGALASAAMTFSAVMVLGNDDRWRIPWPAATCLLHVIAFRLCSRGAPRAPLALSGAGAAALASTAANIGAAMERLDRIAYQTPPTGCYVVTAATRGHAWLVRPMHAEDDGATRENRQIAVLRAFESRWRATSPHAHRIARQVYDRIGPLLAARVTNAWLADLAYLSLKPLEWLARCWLGRRG